MFEPLSSAQGGSTARDLLTLTHALAEAVADQNNDPAQPIRRVDIALELSTLADDALREAVTAARTAGTSWQAIGNVLGTSRQAAFQRFGTPDHDRDGAPMKIDHASALIPRAEAAYHHLESGDYRPVADQMTFVVQRLLTEKKVLGVWSKTTTQCGRLESLGTSFARPSGATTVVETPLSFEAGEYVGRIAYNRRGKIAGMVILPPDAVASGPF